MNTRRGPHNKTRPCRNGRACLFCVSAFANLTGDCFRNYLMSYFPKSSSSVGIFSGIGQEIQVVFM